VTAVSEVTGGGNQCRRRIAGVGVTEANQPSVRPPRLGRDVDDESRLATRTQSNAPSPKYRNPRNARARPAVTRKTGVPKEPSNRCACASVWSERR